MEFRNSLVNRSAALLFSINETQKASSNFKETKITTISSHDNYLALLYYLHGDIEKAYALLNQRMNNTVILSDWFDKENEKRSSLLESHLHYCLNMARLYVGIGNYSEAEKILRLVYSFITQESNSMVSFNIKHSDLDLLSKCGSKWTIDIILNNICGTLTRLNRARGTLENLFEFFVEARSNKSLSDKDAILQGFGRSLCLKGRLDDARNFFRTALMNQSKYSLPFNQMLDIAEAYIEGDFVENAKPLLSYVIRQAKMLIDTSYKRYATAILCRAAQLLKHVDHKCSIDLAKMTYNLSQEELDEIGIMRSLIILLDDKNLNEESYVLSAQEITDNSLYSKERIKIYFLINRIAKNFPGIEMRCDMFSNDHKCTALQKRYGLNPVAKTMKNSEISSYSDKLEEISQIEHFITNTTICEENLRNLWGNVYNNTVLV